MFYCDPCAKRNQWPYTIFRSFGACEGCGKLDDCNETPSNLLPTPE